MPQHPLVRRFSTWRPAHQFHLLQPPLILFLLHTWADREEEGEEEDQEDLADQGVMVDQVALADQVALEDQVDLADQVALEDTVAMAGEGQGTQDMTLQADPSITLCPSLHKCLVC